MPVLRLLLRRVRSTAQLGRVASAALLLAALAQPGVAAVWAAAPAHVIAAPLPPPPPCPKEVTTTADSGPGSLRNAVGCALLGETVTFSNTLAGATINLTSTININVPLAINGSGAPGVKLDGGGTTNLFTLAANGPVTLTALTLQNGSAVSGGALYADSTSPLLLNQVDVLSSTATNKGGGLVAGLSVTINGGRFEGNLCTFPSCLGGGLYSWGPLVISGTQFINNRSYWDGGGAHADGAVTLTGGRFERNACTGTGCYGGALFADSTLALTGTQFLTNTSTSHGGAVNAGASTVLNGLFQGNSCSGASCKGGAYMVSGGPSTFTGTNFISNTSIYHGGALAGDNVLLTIIAGSFQRNVCSTSNCYGGGLYSTGSFVVTGTQFISNTSQRSGGGAYSDGPQTVNNALFQGNSCVLANCYGGGLVAGTTLTLTNATFLSNTAELFGGGLFSFELALVNNSYFQGNICASASCEGAGLAAQGPARVTNSTFVGNHTYGSGGGLSGRDALTVVNVTVSGNTADSNGGGIYVSGLGAGTLLNVTVANNTAVGAGGLYVDLSASVGVTNTLFSNNGDDTCAGAIDFGSHNLEWPNGTCATAGPTAGFNTADALLASLALNAPGTTATHALLANSPARDAGDAATCAGPLVNNLDQRGVTRPIDGDAVLGAVCDIGAFEADPPVWFLYLPLTLR